VRTRSRQAGAKSQLRWAGGDVAVEAGRLRGRSRRGQEGGRRGCGRHERAADEGEEGDGEARRLRSAVESGERMQIGPHGELGDRGEGGVSDRIQWEWWHLGLSECHH
jgi:hypothetical protein